MAKNFTIMHVGDSYIADVDLDGHRFAVRLTPEGLEYFTTEGCDCGMVPILEIQKVMVSGEDDCPVHGLKGKENEQPITEVGQ